LNGVTRRKTALCAEVAGAMTLETKQNEELEKKLLTPLSAVLGS
jgi:hypothetical protein